MFTLFLLTALLGFSRSKEEAPVALDVLLVDYDAMYDNECSKSTSTSASASASADSTPTSSNYAHGWEKWTKPNDDKDESPGSVKGNELSGKGDSQQQQQQSAVFCKCLAEEKKKGKSYADSQNAFSKCIDKANGNDASHWKKVSSRYQHKYGINVVPSSNPNGALDIDDAETVIKEAKAEVKAKAKDAETEIKEEGKEISEGNGDTAEDVVSKSVPDEGMMVQTPSTDSGSFGNTAIFVTLIGSSVLLVICGWFIKGSAKNWGSKEYEQIKMNHNVVSYQSECKQEKNGSYNGYNVV